jgi:hypothetical protein
MSQWQIQITEFKMRVSIDQARDDRTFAQVNEPVSIGAN